MYIIIASWGGGGGGCNPRIPPRSAPTHTHTHTHTHTVVTLAFRKFSYQKIVGARGHVFDIEDMYVAAVVAE